MNGTGAPDADAKSSRLSSLDIVTPAAMTSGVKGLFSHEMAKEKHSIAAAHIGVLGKPREKVSTAAPKACHCGPTEGP